MHDHGGPDARPGWARLAHRAHGGIEIALLWRPSLATADHELRVAVCDSRNGAYFEIPVDPRLALDVFQDPYAYRRFSTVDYEDRRLASFGEGPDSRRVRRRAATSWVGGAPAPCARAGRPTG